MAIPPAAQYHVLAVDDSHLHRKLIERLLKISSYQVTTVDSGNKALEFLGLQDDQETSPSLSSYHQDSEVNLVITDYCMPGITGYDLLKRIKESAYLKDIPVVVMSSENNPSRINRCLEEGAEEFFLKPVKLSDLKKLRPHLKGKSTFEEEKAQQQHKQIGEQLEISQHQSSKLQSNHFDNLPIIGASIPTTTSNINKRKVIDEGISPERTRPSYSDYGLTAEVV